MEAKSSERRYNTRFRGVPRSIFTYSRKKSSSKSNDEVQSRSDLRNDFIYTKLGKKPATYGRESINQSISPPKVKIKMETISNTIKQEKATTENEPIPNLVPNGTHKPSAKINNSLDGTTDIINSTPIVKLEVKSPEVDVEIDNLPKIKAEVIEESSPELSPKSGKEIDGVFFEKSSDADEIHSTFNNSEKPSWIMSKEKLSWNNSTVASYNPKTKMFRCVVCHAVGFMSRIGEHYLGTHCNAKVFHCPQCSYCSAWWRCVRNHMSKNHGVSNAPASMWKNQPLLDEIMQILQNLKYSVDCEDRVERVAENCGKRYICPKCPYATDRRDLYNRHENIHREEKPFQCYICYKLFNRADHVKKHFCRIHKEFNYDINLIRRLPSKRSRIPISPSLNGGSSGASQEMSSSYSDMIPKPSPHVPVTQSQLLNCLTGSPTMVRLSREIDQIPEKEANLFETKNDNTFNKSHSNLLTFLTQNAFSPKPIHKSAPIRNPEPPKDILQEALLKPLGFSSLQSSAPKKYNCAYCPWTGPNAWALRIHTSMHYKTFCVLCNFKSSEASDLENHMWECHKKKTCSKCNFLADSIGALDAHLKEVHGQKPQFSCRHCAQSFEVRSDMEAHCIFIHNQVLQECKTNGCDFCTTDPDILEIHKKENHSSSSTSQDTSASRTLCLYCGCDFADPASLSLHEEVFHENPLQKTSRRPLNPYGCSVCGYSTPKQPMMMEHMRIHTGQALRCQAGEGCQFATPYDTVLREHVLQSHSNDDGIVRCPHCGFRCSTRFSFVTHYKELHHPFCCQLCEDIEHKHFVQPFTTSYLESSIKAMFPFAKQVSSASIASQEKSNDDSGRRSRKQMQPRKVLVHETNDEQPMTGENVAYPSKRNVKRSSSRNRERDKFISLYSKKVRKIAQMPLLKCRFCVKCPIFFRHKRNYLLHRHWHSLKKHQCNKCIQTFCHRYQVLIHQREHNEKMDEAS